MASGVPSNFATIPVALSGRVCSDDPVLAPVTPEELQNLASLASVNVGSISLTNVAPVLEAPGPPAPTWASAPTWSRLPTHPCRHECHQRQFCLCNFSEIHRRQFASPGFLQQTSMGGGLVVDGGIPLMGWNDFASLSAGPQVDINGPYGTVALTAPFGGTYIEPGSLPAGFPARGGGGILASENGSGSGTFCRQPDRGFHASPDMDEPPGYPHNTA